MRRARRMRKIESHLQRPVHLIRSRHPARFGEERGMRLINLRDERRDLRFGAVRTVSDCAILRRFCRTAITCSPVSVSASGLKSGWASVLVWGLRSL